MENEKTTLFDIVKTGQELFAKELMFEGYISIREQINRSELCNEAIWQLLVGDISLFWESNDVFYIIDKPNHYQKSIVQPLKEKYENLMSVENKDYEILKEIDYSFFDMVSPRRFKEDSLQPVSAVKAFMFEVVGDYFIIKNNKVYFLKETKIKEYNPFIKKDS